MAVDLKCARCELAPSEISEYVEMGKLEGMSPEDFVILEEGTYNEDTGKFWCTDCYIAIGMPLGVAR